MLKHNQLVAPTYGGEVWLRDATAARLKPKAHAIMMVEYRSFVDLLTDELQVTHLAELVAQELDLYGPVNFVEWDECVIPQDVFEWVLELEDDLITDGKVQSIC